MYKGELIPMNFSFGKFKEGWRFYDVKIEGVSYIKNYRNQFNAEITANGIDAVIDRLETMWDLEIIKVYQIIFQIIFN